MTVSFATGYISVRVAIRTPETGVSSSIAFDFLVYYSIFKWDEKVRRSES